MQYPKCIQQMKKIRKECAVVKNVNTQNWKSKSSALIKIKASPSSEVGTITELSGLPTEIREDNLEKVVIAICHKLRLENQVKSKDI